MTKLSNTTPVAGAADTASASSLNDSPPKVLAAPVHATPPEYVHLLDPSVIDPGTAFNRSAQAMHDESFEELALSILLTGGNLQPIQVRRLQETQGDDRYALISGARRLAACARHGLQVRVVVIDVSVEQALIARLIENHLREPLCAWELGQQVAHVRQQCGANLSVRKLAGLIGIDHALVHKALDIAALPAEVVQAFASPKDIRYGDAKALKDALAQAPEPVLDMARALKDQQQPAKQVLQSLVKAAQAPDTQQGGVEPFNTPINVPLKVQGSVVGQIHSDKNGQLVIALQTPMSLPQQQALAQCVEQFIARKVLRLKASEKVAANDAAWDQSTEIAPYKSAESASTSAVRKQGGAV